MSDEQQKTRYISSFWLQLIQIVTPIVVMLILMYVNDKVQDTEMSFIKQSLIEIKQDFKEFKIKVEQEFKDASRERDNK